MSGPRFSQNHSGSGHNIMNFGRQSLQMTKEQMARVFSDIQGMTIKSLTAVGSQRSIEAASALQEYLRERGIHTTLNRIGTMAPPMAGPLELRGDSLHVNADI